MKDKYKKYIEYIARDIELPYIKSLEPYGLKQDEMDLVLSKVFNQPVTIKGRDVYNTNGNLIYIEYSNGFWIKYEYDNNGNIIYYEKSNGSWRKSEYDDNGNLIYLESSNGFWEKREYDTNSNLIYYEYSDGVIMDRRYERQV
tara:strand:- start:4474 stop:4902 length:429 start_codon:yes stop_codon:yes gene_type:complete